MGVLRRPAHRERHARHAPRRGARLQGRLPALPHDEGLLRPPDRRLGLPRPPRGAGGREGARLHRQAGHRALRRRRVQRAVPGVRPPPRRRVHRHDPAHGLLGRLRRRLLDDGQGLRPERLVVAQADLRQGPAGPGPSGGALLPALRHRPVRPRDRAGLRDRRRPLGVRALPGGCRVGAGPAAPRCRAAGVDHDAVDPGVQHGRRREARRRRTPSSARPTTSCWSPRRSWSRRCSATTPPSSRPCRARPSSMSATSAPSTTSTSPTRTT